MWLILIDRPRDGLRKQTGLLVRINQGVWPRGQSMVDISKETIQTIKRTIVHFFLVLSHMFGWSKNYWADCEKVCFFLNIIFMSVRILGFNAIHLVIMGPVRNGIFYFWIFFNETYDNNKIIIWKFHWNRAQEITRFYTTKLFISAKHVPKLEISHCRKN
jgi:hypothetical protein